MDFCRYCGADEADAKFCARCGMATAPLSGGASSIPAGAEDPPAADFVTGDNTAGALAYLLLPAVYFLFLTDTYKQNRFVRFHSYQALFYCGGLLALIWIVWSVLEFILGYLVYVVAWLMTMASFVFWAKLLIRAYQGQMYKIPVIGDLAEKQL